MKKRAQAAMLLCLMLVIYCAPVHARTDTVAGVDLSKPLTVEECVKVALENNYDVAIARSNVNSSRAATTRAWSGVLPNVSANVYWDRLTQGPTEQLTLNERTGEIITSQTQSQAFVTYSMGLFASQNLFDWSALQNIAQAKASLTAARYSSLAAENDISYEVRRQFYNLVKAQKLLEVREESVERSKGQLERAESLYELGAVAKSDVLRAKVDLAQAELDLITVTNVVELEKVRLAKMMGLESDREISIESDLEFEEVDLDRQHLPETAAANRPDLRAAAERLRAGQAGVRAAEGGQYPSFFGSFNWRWRDDEFPNATSDFSSRYTWDVAMGISIPIFDGMVTRGNIGEARAALTTREREYEEVRDVVELEIKEALIGLEEARQRIRLSEQQLESAQESYNLAEEQYEVGLGTILELTAAGVELTLAESQRVDAITDYKVAIAFLDRASGGQLR